MTAQRTAATKIDHSETVILIIDCITILYCIDQYLKSIIENTTKTVSLNRDFIPYR